VPIAVYIRLYLLMMVLDTPETCTDWRNILRIICASSWFSITRFMVILQVRVFDSLYFIEVHVLHTFMLCFVESLSFAGTLQQFCCVANWAVFCIFWLKAVGSETVCRSPYSLGRRYTCRSFATRVSQLIISHFWVIGIERNVCRCASNGYSVITQFAKLAAGEQFCRRCTHRKV